MGPPHSAARPPKAARGLQQEGTEGYSMRGEPIPCALKSLVFRCPKLTGRKKNEREKEREREREREGEKEREGEGDEKTWS